MDDKTKTDIQTLAKGVKNPQPILEAVVAPDPLTVGQIALLERVKSHVLYRDISNHADNVKTVYALEIDRAEAMRRWNDGDFEAEAFDWADKLGWQAYSEKLAKVVSGVVGFWKMMPKGEEKKKAMSESGTGGSES